jgi:hypothetical protein
VTEKTRRGPSLAALASLITLAVSLWMEVELSSAFLRAVLVYLGIAMLMMGYRVILGHYLAASEAKARKDLLDKVQREAEEEVRSQQETAGAEKKAREAKTAKTAAVV